MDEYVKHLHKKHKTQPFDADTLITCKIVYLGDSNKFLPIFYYRQKRVKSIER